MLNCIEYAFAFIVLVIYSIGRHRRLLQLAIWEDEKPVDLVLMEYSFLH